MTYLLAFLIVFLLAVVVVQIGKLSELAARIRGEEAVERANNQSQGVSLMVFMVVFLVGCIVSAWMYRNDMLGYGPLTSASAHGFELDEIFNVTLIFTGIVFVLTHILLFWYSYKYRDMGNRKALFFAHDTKLEMIWTVVPAVVMTFLVAKGLIAWNNIFPTLTEEDKYLEIEATGYQFAWDIRYPGADGKLGNKDFRLIDPAANSLGIDWNDEASLDDVVLGGSDKILLPKDSLVKVRITAKDVLHNFYLPHFRVKMDAVPGLPTSFIFTPVKTTQEFRQQLSKFPEWQVPADPAEPNGPKKWETFNYELACAELCGKGHYSMRRIVEVVTREEFDTWLAGQKSFYAENVRGTKADPWAGKKLFKSEVRARELELKNAVKSYLDDTTGTATNEVPLKQIYFADNTANLDLALSSPELDNLSAIMSSYNSLKVELTVFDNGTQTDANTSEMAQSKTDAIKNYLVSKGVSADRVIAKGPVASGGDANGDKTGIILKILSK